MSSPTVDAADAVDPLPGGTDDAGDAGAPSVEEQWRRLVSAALLGTDRRDPPEPVGPIAELVADTARSSPSERMLAHVAAAVTVRRAGVLPGPPVAPLHPPESDDRRECVPAAVERWHHVVASWQVLEDEWMIVLVANGWRLAAELVPLVLRRHRRDPLRHLRARVAAGPLGEWMIEQLPELGPTSTTQVDADVLAELPPLPIPPEFAELLSADGAEAAEALFSGITSGELGHAHRGVLINLVARVEPGSLEPVATRLAAVDPASPGAGLAATLADLARTRHRMLDELGV